MAFIAVFTSVGWLGFGVLFAQPAAAATDLYAAPTGINNANCLDASDACDLQTALNDVSAGGTILLVTAGTENSSNTYYSGGYSISTSGTSSTSPVTIEPDPGLSASPILDGGETATVLEVNNAMFLTIEGVTIQNGAGNDGGGIDNSSGGTLTVTDSTFSNDSAGDSAGNGGGIDNADGGTGTLTVTDTTFSNDSAGNGGGIDNGDHGGTGTLTVTDSTFSNDSAGYNGGAIENGDDGGTGTLTVTDTTLSNDSAAAGGGIDNGAYGGNGTATITASTFSNVSAAYGGPAIDNGGDGGNGTLTLTASILAGSCSQNGGSWTDGGYNVDVDGSCENGGTDDATSSSLQSELAAPADNGGGIETVALLNGNPGIGLIPNPTAGLCPVSADERGIAGATGEPCDAGAVQLTFSLPTNTVVYAAAASTGTGTCLDQADACPLSTALGGASPGDTIELTTAGDTNNSATWYSGNFTIATPGDSSSDPITIEPATGVTDPILDGGDNGTVLTVATEVPLTIEGVTIQDGAGNDGGGIDNSSGGTLTVTDTTLSNDSAGNGGGIDNADGGTGTLTVTDSTFDNTSATYNGGGIDNGDNYGNGTATITASTFSNVSAGNGGPAIDNGDDGGNGTLTLTASILAGSCSQNGGSWTDGGYNVDVDGSCENGGTDDATSSSLQSELAAPADNGGGIETVALLNGNPGIGLIPNPTAGLCPVSADERGIAGATGEPCDAGAVQLTFSLPTNTVVYAAAASTGTGTCLDQADACPLSTALGGASPGDTIELTTAGDTNNSATWYSGNFTIATPGDSSSDPITIEPATGVTDPILDGGDNGTVLTVATEVPLTIEGVTIQDGAGNDGGGIDNSSGGTLTVTDTTLSNDSAGNGGGIDNADGGTGTLTVTDSTFDNTSATYNGGGIDNGDNYGNGTATITASTFSNVSAGNGGPAIDNGDDGGNGTLTLTASILAGSCSQNGGSWTDGGYNVDVDGSCENGGTDDATSSSLQSELAAPADNGGGIETVALLNGNPGIGLIPNPTAGLCPVSADERGIAGATGEPCDAGAVQLTFSLPTNTVVYAAAASTGTGTCLDQADACPLSTALGGASPGDTIELTTAGDTNNSATWYSGNFTIATPGDSSSDPITIEPATGVTDPILDGGDNGTVLTVATEVPLTIEGVTIQDGAGNDGGGIDNSSGGTLTVTDTTLSNDSAGNGDGGGIDNASGGTLTVTDTTFSNDSAGDGGGIDNADGGTGTLTVTDSTFSNDSAGYDGGAIDNGDNDGTGTLTVTDSTFDNTSATYNGGGIDNGDNYGNGTATITASTFSNVSAGNGGPAIDNGDDGGNGTLTLTASILAGSCSQNGGSWTDGGYNVDVDGSCENGGTDDATSSSLQSELAAPADNGGGIETVALLNGNPGIGLIPNPTAGLCPVSADERGIAGATGEPCDAGAVQLTFSLPTNTVVYAAAASTGTGTCLDQADACPLSTALGGASPGDTIELTTAGDTNNSATWYSGNFTIATPGDSSSDPITIEPATGVTDPILDGGDNGTVLTVATEVPLTIEGVTIQDGAGNDGGGIDNSSGGTLTVTDTTLSNDSAGNGGGIDNADGGTGTLTVTDSTFSNDSAGYDGGAIDNGDDGGTGTLTVTDTTFDNTSATYDGGGIDNGDYGGTGTATVTDSTFDNTSATYNGGGGGGGIDNADGGTGTLTVTDSTFDNTSSAWDGGGIDNADGGTGTATITASTFSNVSAGFDGPAIDNGDFGGNGTLTLTASILAGSCSQNGGSWTDGGYNVDVDGSCENGGTDDATSSSLQSELAAPADNGGGIETVALLNGNPGIGLIPNPTAGLCPVSADERGIAGATGEPCDAGAVQLTSLPTNTVVYAAAASTGTGTCLDQADACPLSTALGGASPGDTIELTTAGDTNNSATWYSGNFTIATPGDSSSDPITIEPATGVTDPILDGGDNGTVLTVATEVPLTIEGVTIQDGAGNDGGGIDNSSGGTLTVTDTTLSNDSAGNGGGIDNADGGTGTLTVTDSTFSNDSAGYDGGAIDNGDDGGTGTLTVTDSTFDNTSSAWDGGGIDNADGGTGTATITASTFSNVSAGYDGPAIDNGDFDGNGTLTLTASILAGSCSQNGGSWTDGGYNVDVDGSCENGGTDDATSSSLQSELAAPADNGGGIETVALLNGNPGIGLIPNPTAGLCPVSADERGIAGATGEPCDAGAVQLTFSLPTNTVVYAAAASTGTGTCLDQADACPLSTALGGASPGDTIELTTAGDTNNSATWYSGNFTIATPGDSSSDPITIEPATGVTDPILDGGDNGTVLTVATEVPLTIEGVTIQDGAGNDGGGIDNSSGGTLTVTDTTFSNDSAGAGGGIDNSSGGTLTVTDTTLSNDSAGNGGGIDNGDDGTGTLTVTDSTFSNDSAGNDGGGIDNGDDGGNGTLTVTDSTFSNDSAGAGGGIDNGDDGGNGTLTVTDSTFSNDSAGYGGAINNADNDGTGTLTVTDTTFSNDSAGAGGGIDNGDDGGNGTLTVTDSTFSNDSAGYGGAINNADNDGTGTLTVTDSTFDNTSATYKGGGIDNADGGNGTATITASTFSNVSAGYGGPAIDNGDDGGNGTLTLTASILAGSCSQNGGSWTDGGYNVDVDGSCENGGTDDATSSSLQSELAAPADNGGGIETVALLNGNPGIGLIPNPTAGLCPVSADERGIAGATGEPCDAGAVQLTFSLPTNTVVYAAAASTGTGTCLDQADACPLSTALGGASPGDTIELTTAGDTNNSATWYSGNFTIATPGDSSSDPITIEPATGVTDPILDGGDNGTVLTVATEVPLTIEGVTIQDGAGNDGGGIDNSSGGTLTVTDTTFSNDSAAGGGGIDNGDDGGTGTLTVTDSTLSNDSAGNDGGAIDNGDDGGTGTLTVTDTTFSNDSAGNDGGAIENGDDGGTGTLTVTDTTFSNDSAGYDGGGIDNGDYGGNGTATITASTFSNVSAAFGGPAIDNGDNDGNGTLTLTASILAGSCSQNGGSWTDGGYNVDVDGSCENGGTDDATSSSLQSELAAPADNGGGIETVALLNGNPGIGLIPNPTAGLCPVSADERGIAGATGEPCDAGAVQLTSLPTNTIVYAAAASTGTGTCLDQADACPLSTALGGASPGDTIELTTAGDTNNSATWYSGNFTIATPGDSSSDPITIEPATGVTDPILDGGDNGTVLTVATEVPLTIEGVTIQDGAGNDGGGIDNSSGGTLTVTDTTLSNDSAGNGGGIDNSSGGTLTVTDTTLSNDSAGNGDGGGIDNSSGGTLTVTDTTLSNDSAGNGGGIDNADGGTGTLTVTDSTFSNDSAGYDGGAIDNGDDGGTGTLTVTDSTFDNTSATWDGGGIDNADGGTGTATITASTFSNVSAGDGGAIDNGDYGGNGTLTLTASILAGSCRQNGGSWTDGGYNVDVDGSCENGGTDDATSSSLQSELAAPADNGGGIETVALLNGNPGIGLIPNPTAGLCPVSADERGIAGATGEPCDAGAVQLAAQTVTFTSTVPSTATVGSTYTPTAEASPDSSATVTISLDTSSAGCTLSGGVVTFTASGTCLIDASQTGSDNFTAASAQQSIQIVGSLTQTSLTSATVSQSASKTYTTTIVIGGNNGTVTLVQNSTDQSSSLVFDASTGQVTTTGGPLAVGSYNISGTDSDTNADAGTWTFTLDVAAAPSAPNSVSAIAGNADVVVNWTPPTTDNYSAITGYDVYEGTTTNEESSTPVNSSPLSSSATTYTVSGLTNGTKYFFVVEAVNAFGNSVASSEVNATPESPATLVFTSEPPTTASTGIALATPLAVSVEDSSGGVIALDATVTLSIGSQPAIGATLSCTSNSVTATNGVATFQNCAISGATGSYWLMATATGLTSATSSAISLSPAVNFTSSPSSTFVIGNANNDTVSASAGTVIESNSDALPSNLTFSGGVLSGTANGDTPGTYTLHFTATSGSATASQTFELTLVASTEPSNVTVALLSNNGTSATVSWTAPGCAPGCITSGYTVTPYDGATAGTATTVSATATSATLSGLTVGGNYTFQVLPAESPAVSAVTTTNSVQPYASTATLTTMSGTPSDSTDGTSDATIGSVGNSGSIVASATGEGTVNVGTYSASPLPSSFSVPSGTTSYDISVAPGSSFTSLSFEVCGDSSGEVEWYDPSTGNTVNISSSDITVLSTGTNCVEVTLTNSTDPSLSQLTGSVFLVEPAVPNSGGGGGTSPTATTTVLVASANPIAQGQTLTLDVTVSGDDPIGTVTFDDGATVLGTATLTNGQASYSTANLSVGTHDLTASYGGDANNDASSSVELVEVVQSASTGTTPPGTTPPPTTTPTTIPPATTPSAPKPTPPTDVLKPGVASTTVIVKVTGVKVGTKLVVDESMPGVKKPKVASAKIASNHEAKFATGKLPVGVTVIKFYETVTKKEKVGKKTKLVTTKKLVRTETVHVSAKKPAKKTTTKKK